MADVRSLLRQQRAARRIEHPLAAYSDAGKLLCLACHESVKSDSLWESHLRSPAHRSKAINCRPQKPDQPQPAAAAASAAQDHHAQPSQKRKHGDDDDEDMADADSTAATVDDAVRKKRSRPDMGSATDSDTTMASPAGSNSTPAGRREGGRTPQSQTRTPPLTRRQSGTPVMGVEMQMPSRPATPNARDGAAAGVIGLGVRHSPLMPQEPLVKVTSAGPGALPPHTTTLTTPPEPAGPIDEVEWAAFEREVVNAPQATAAAALAPAAAVISADPMTADQVAEERELTKRKAAVDVELEDEREEATRAMETEFEEMEELEARVRRLKERREALRRQPEPEKSAAASGSIPKATTATQEDAAEGTYDLAHGRGEEEDDDDAYDDDDWDNFRFRG